MNTPQRQGLFIVVEGMDGSGKTTATATLAELLTQAGVALIQTYEVGGTPVAKELRNLALKKRADDIVDPTARLLMILAARTQHLKTVVYPATSSGKTVVCDRFFQSTLVYQGKIDGLEESYRSLVRSPVLKFCAQAPDVLVYLNVDADVAYHRGVARANVDNDVYKNDLARNRRIKEAYDEVIADHVLLKDTVVLPVNANGDVDSVVQQLRNVVTHILSLLNQQPILSESTSTI